MDKKTEKAARDKFNLHVALIMHEGHTKPNASFRAWLEGEEGLEARLGTPRLPLAGIEMKGGLTDKVNSPKA